VRSSACQGLSLFFSQGRPPLAGTVPLSSSKSPSVKYRVRLDKSPLLHIGRTFSLPNCSLSMGESSPPRVVWNPLQKVFLPRSETVEIEGFFSSGTREGSTLRRPPFLSLFTQRHPQRSPPPPRRFSSFSPFTSARYRYPLWKNPPPPPFLIS